VEEGEDRGKSLGPLCKKKGNLPAGPELTRPGGKPAVSLKQINGKSSVEDGLRKPLFLAASDYESQRGGQKSSAVRKPRKIEYAEGDKSGAALYGIAQKAWQS